MKVTSIDLKITKVSPEELVELKKMSLPIFNAEQDNECSKSISFTLEVNFSDVARSMGHEMLGDVKSLIALAEKAE